MENFINEKVKNYILVYCLTDTEGTKMFKRENFNLMISKSIISPNFLNTEYFEQYYYIFKGFVNERNVISDGYFQYLNNELKCVSDHEIFDIKKLIPFMNDNEINVLYKDNFYSSEIYLSREEKEQRLLEKEKIFDSNYIKFGMRFKQ